MKQTYKLNESELRGLIAECVQEVLNEEQKEGLVGDMFRGIRQGIKNYNAANKTNNNISAWYDKDIDTLNKMEQRYASVNDQIKTAISNLKSQMYNAKVSANRNVTAKNTAYNTAKTGVQDAKKQRSETMQNRIGNAIYPGQQNTQPAPTDTQQPEQNPQQQQ